MNFKLKYFKNILGALNRFNDIIYSSPHKPSCHSRVLVFFCGDIQDFRENMMKHQDSKQFQEWSLENTAKLMSEHFPQNYILIIRPSRRKVLSNAVFNCFDNFVQGSEFGEPSFCSNHNSLLHLKILLQSISNEKISQDAKNVLNEGELSLMGFSKGCVVLNQFLHEIHYHQNLKERDEEIAKFISRIKEMSWLDGGHSGQKDTWITDETILDSFVKTGIYANIHVTPYQIKDDRRPWIRIEEQTFSNTLQKKGANIKRFVHFEDEPPKLERHFNVLKEIIPVL